MAMTRKDFRRWTEDPTLKGKRERWRIIIIIIIIIKAYVKQFRKYPQSVTLLEKYIYKFLSNFERKNVYATRTINFLLGSYLTESTVCFSCLDCQLFLGP
jgi:hypothetical protein